MAAVGGLVRDVLLGRVDERTDLDLVVEGSAPAVAQAVARELGGRTVEHPVFPHGDRRPAGRPPGRLRDRAARVLPRGRARCPAVERASLAEDLGRRDFSLNALAVRLDGAERGRLVDTTGGLADLRARRIRVLHPLSFVEDPTRILRAARFAARLGCRIDPTTRRLAAHAARLDVYRALSGDRLRTELELLLAEPRPVAALREAGRLGAWRLLGAPGPAGAGRRRGASPRRSPRARSPGSLPTPRSPSCLLALTEGSAAIEAWMDRLSLAPARRESIRQRAPRRPAAGRPPRRRARTEPPRTAY